MRAIGKQLAAPCTWPLHRSPFCISGRVYLVGHRAVVRQTLFSVRLFDGAGSTVGAIALISPTQDVWLSAYCTLVYSSKGASPSMHFSVLVQPGCLAPALLTAFRAVPGAGASWKNGTTRPACTISQVSRGQDFPRQVRGTWSKILLPCRGQALHGRAHGYHHPLSLQEYPTGHDAGFRAWRHGL